MNLNIITPCCRIENLEIIYQNLLDNNRDDIKITWWVIFDKKIHSFFDEYVYYFRDCMKENNSIQINLLKSDKQPAYGGHSHRNVLLSHFREMMKESEWYEDDWVYNLDDDNILHPKFLEFLSNKKDDLINYDILVVGQLDRNNNLRLDVHKDKIKVCHVDTAMFMFKMKTIKNLSFLENYCADGHFIEELYNNKDYKFYLENTPLSYYNFIKEKKRNLNGCPVPILQNEFEFNELLKIYKQLKPKNLLEIGTFYGGSLWHWLENNNELERVVIIDSPVPSSDGRYNEMVDSKLRWKGWLKKHENMMFISLEGDSKDEKILSSANTIFNDKGVDFLFIDGGHDYNTVKSDFENYSKLVKEGGLIVLHDVCSLTEVKRYWEEIKHKYRYIEISDNITGGFGIGIIKK